MAISDDVKKSKVCEFQNLLQQQDYTARKVVFELAQTLKNLYHGLSLPLYEKYKENEEKADGWRKIIDVCDSDTVIDDDIFEDFCQNPDMYIVEDGKLILNPDYETEQQEKEQERINNLNLTGADVERGILNAKGMNFDDIISLVENNPPEGVTTKALEVELKANRFYRGNSFVAAIGKLLGISDDNLTKFF